MSFGDPIELVAVLAEFLILPLDRTGRLAMKFHSESAVGSDLVSRSEFDRVGVLGFCGFQDFGTKVGALDHGLAWISLKRVYAAIRASSGSHAKGRNA